MSYPVLSLGSKGSKVKELRTLLESVLRPEHRDYLGTGGHLEITSTFDEDVEGCVMDFQDEAYLKKDGVVGSLTWRALKGEETYCAYDIPARVICNNSYHCWAACTAMLKGNAVMDNTTRVPGVIFENVGNSIGGLENSHANVSTFAKYHGFEFKQAGSWSCDDLCRYALHYGRLMLNIRGITPNLQSSPNPDDSHWVILAGLRGNGTRAGTTLYLFNPSTTGPDYQVVHTYQYLKSIMPQISYQVMYKIGNSSKRIY